MDWSPDTDTISQVLLMLQSLRDPTCDSHQQALQTLSTDTANPTFVLHLVHIFSRGGNYEGIATDIRQLAGLITKNYVFPRLIELADEVFSIVKVEIINGLADPLPTIRNTAALLIGRISASFMMSYWVDIMEMLLEGAIRLPEDMSTLQGDENAVAMRIDGSLLAVKRICEDSAEKLFMDTDNRPLEALIPQLITVFASPITSHRLKGIESINALIYLIPAEGGALGGTPCALVSYMGSFLTALSQMAADPSASIRRAVCQALVLLTSFQVAVLVPMLAEVCEFMLQNISDQDEGVAMEACEFWWEFLKNRESAEYLLLQHESAGATSVLSSLIPALISRFPLTTEQIEFEREEDEATASGEKEVNFKPVHHTARGGGTAGGDSDNDDGDDEGGGGDGNGDGGGVSVWSLRRQAARVLDLLAYSIPPYLTLSIALPVVQANFQNSDVWIFETGMLTLGALSNGCSDDMAQYLPDLLSILLSSVQGNRVLESGQVQEFPHEVRCISCWVLGRYSEFWFTEADDEEYYPTKTMNIDIQKSIIQVLMAAMLDPVPRLQAASCSALTAVFESVAASAIDSDDPTTINILDVCLSDMLLQFNRAFEAFGVKNSLILCDTVGTLCDSIAPNSLQTAFVSDKNDLSSLILNPLVQKFSLLLQMQDPSAEGSECAPHPHLYPVMECLTSVSTAVGLDFIPFATELVKMILQLISSVMDAHDQHHTELQEGADEETLDDLPGIDFAVCGLDVLSSIVEGLKVAFPMVVLSLPIDNGALRDLPISPELLQPFCQHGFGEEIQRGIIFLAVRGMSFPYSSDIRQSAFSLVGDLISEGGCISLFATPLASSIALTFPPIVPRNEVGVNFLDESFMSLCSEGPSEGGPFFLTPCALYVFQLAVYQFDVQAALVAPLVANNAIWVVGEYCLAAGSGSVMDKLICSLSCQMAGLMQHVMTLDGTSAAAIQSMGQEDSNSPLALKQNLAIAIGRLLFLSPQAASAEPNPLLYSEEGTCLQCFCKACSLIQPSDSRDHAFLGLIALLNVDPQILLQSPKSIEQFCFSCASWESPPYDPQIFSGLRDILLACTATPSWGNVMRALNGAQRLHHVFQLQ